MSIRSAATAGWNHRERATAAIALGVAAVGFVAFVTGASFPHPVTHVSSWVPDEVPALAWDRLYLARALVEILRPVLLVVLVVSGPGRRLIDRLTSWMSSPVIGGALAAVDVLVVVDVLTLPVSWWGRVGRSDPLGWFAEWLLTHAQTWALVGLLAAGLTVAMRRWPDTWHWRAVLVGVALATAIPLAADLDPFAGELRQLPEGPVRERVESAVEAAGAGDVPLRVGDGRAASELGAYVSGIGPSRSIIFSSALMRGFPPDQVAFVAMHELAHREHLDVYRKVVGTGAGLLVGIWMLRIVLRWPSVRHQVAQARVPEVRRVIVALTVVAVVHTMATPVANLASRRSEAAADWRALELTADAGSAIGIQRFLLENGGADPSPPAWYQSWLATHPSASERIGLALRYARSQGIVLEP